MESKPTDAIDDGDNGIAGYEVSRGGVVIAALVGANGLGVPVVRALNAVNTALGFESGFVIVIVAIVLDRMLRKGDA